MSELEMMEYFWDFDARLPKADSHLVQREQRWFLFITCQTVQIRQHLSKAKRRPQESREDMHGNRKQAPTKAI